MHGCWVPAHAVDATWCETSKAGLASTSGMQRLHFHVQVDGMYTNFSDGTEQHIRQVRSLLNYGQVAPADDITGFGVLCIGCCHIPMHYPNLTRHSFLLLYAGPRVLTCMYARTQRLPPVWQPDAV
jgi:hypothetical protein